MDLKDFVSETLKQITEGVIEAQKQAKAVGAWINPQDRGACTAFSVQNPTKVRFAEIVGPNHTGYLNEVHVVEFHVALTVTEREGKESGIGIAKILNVGTSRESAASEESVTNIRFNVPIVFPHQK